jgi:hypothetical protein
MRLYTAHLKARRPPRLVREGFSWGALIFGPFWLLARGAWIPAGLVLALDLGLGFVPGRAGLVLMAAAALGVGIFGHDLRRWALGLGGWQMAGVVAARDEDGAFARLLGERPELAGLAAFPL